jgi:hypothetical protein
MSAIATTGVPLGTKMLNPFFSLYPLQGGQHRPPFGPSVAALAEVETFAPLKKQGNLL